MKKLIPAIVAIVLICVVILFGFGKPTFDKYSYGTEKADLNEYFEIFSSDAVPIILQNEKIPYYGKLINGRVYFEKGLLSDLLTSRFYFDENENLLLYTSDKTTFTVEMGSKSVSFDGKSENLDYEPAISKGGKLYIALDYAKRFVNFTYELFDEPHRIQLYTEWNDKIVADIKNDTEVRWRAGVKSEILTSVKKGDKVETLGELDDWTMVKTSDAFIGYVPTKFLGEVTKEIACPASDVPKEQYSCLTKDTKINLVWHNIEYPQGASELYNACAKIKEVNVISPTWYWLNDNEGNFSSIATKDYVEAAHKMDMEVWPLVANFHTDTDVNLLEVITYTSKRAKLISGLVEETLKYGCEGINVDFESVPPEAGDNYIQFIRELALECHKNNLILSVDNHVPTEYTAFYNREEQGKFADYVIIMGYDEHYNGSEIGSVSGISWMTDGIKNTMAVVPAKKVINAIPFYTRVWKTKGGEITSEAVTMAVAKDFLKKNKLETTWDEATGQNYAEGTIGNTFYQVWMEDYDSVQARLNIMNTLGIGGAAAWRLGQETADIWELYEAYMSY